MKTVKLTILFKNGAEKSYIVPESSEDDIGIIRGLLKRNIGNADGSLNISFDYANIIIAPSEIASAEIEILQS